MTIDITTNALVAVLALCFTFCWVGVAGRKHRNQEDAKHPGKPGAT
jgi:hypothetical protein